MPRELKGKKSMPPPSYLANSDDRKHVVFLPIGTFVQADDAKLLRALKKKTDPDSVPKSAPISRSKKKGSR
jgi:hypothetical protein